MVIPCTLNNPSVAYTIDPDTIAFVSAASITDPLQEAAINQLVVGLKTNNLWAKMLAVYPFIGGTATAHKLNLKDPQDTNGAKRLLFAGSWTHATTGSKVTAAASTNFARTYILHNELSQDDNHMSIYSRTNLGGNAIDIGVWLGAGNNSYLSCREQDYAGAMHANNNPSAIAVNTRADSLGHFIGVRPSSALVKIYAAGLPSGSAAGASGPSSATVEFAISGLMLAGNASVTVESSREYAFASFGSSLNDAESLALYTLVQSVQTLLSRNV